MSSVPWFRWYPADYRRKTMHLSFVEDCAYRRLIEAYMDRRGPLPADQKSLYRLCSAQDDSERRAIDSVTGEFFTNGDGKLRHARCDEELANQSEQAKSRSDHASRAAKARWYARSNARAMPEQCSKMLDSDSDSDSDSKALKSNHARVARSPAVKTPSTKGTRLTDDWRLPDEWLQWALIIRPDWTSQGVVRESITFRDFWLAKSGQNAVKLNWLATWRNWIRRCEQEPVR